MIIYFGDDNINGPAAYLSGIMLYHGISFERVDGTAVPPEEFDASHYDAYILSDYPRSNFEPEQLERIREAVRSGSGLLMIGGWESFHGLLGEYGDTVLADVLPVEMSDRDDRCNFPQSAMVYRSESHPILDGLPWETPPFIGGLNRFAAKPESRTVLEAIGARVRITDENDVAENVAGTKLPDGSNVSLTLTDVYPLLVLGRYGKGRTAALATDVAPHWIGGFVDWGRERLTQSIPDGGSIEVGADYATFFARLVRWTAGFDLARSKASHPNG